MFAPLEYGDKDAAQLRGKGRWTEQPEHYFRMFFDSVETLRGGTLDPPITEEEIYYTAGKSLGKPMNASCDRMYEHLHIKVSAAPQPPPVAHHPWPPPPVTTTRGHRLL